MKTQEELNALKEEVEALNKKLADLSEDELAKVHGAGSGDKGKKAPINGKCPFCNARLTPAGSDPWCEVLFWNCPNCGQIRVFLMTNYWVNM